MTTTKATAPNGRHPGGPPKLFPDYDPHIGLLICFGIACGRSLREIATEHGLPDRSTVYGWVLDVPEFATAYSRARELAAHALADDLIAISDTATAENAQAVRTQITTRQWVLARMLPRVYGDKITADVTLSATLEQLVLKSLERQASDEPRTIEHEADTASADE